MPGSAFQDLRLANPTVGGDSLLPTGHLASLGSGPEGQVGNPNTFRSPMCPEMPRMNIEIFGSTYFVSPSLRPHAPHTHITKLRIILFAPPRAYRRRTPNTPRIARSGWSLTTPVDRVQIPQAYPVHHYDQRGFSICDTLTPTTDLRA